MAMARKPEERDCARGVFKKYEKPDGNFGISASYKSLTIKDIFSNALCMNYIFIRASLVQFDFKTRLAMAAQYSQQGEFYEKSVFGGTNSLIIWKWLMK